MFNYEEQLPAYLQVYGKFHQCSWYLVQFGWYLEKMVYHYSVSGCLPFSSTRAGFQSYMYVKERCIIQCQMSLGEK